MKDLKTIADEWEDSIQHIPFKDHLKMFGWLAITLLGVFGAIALN